MNTQDHSLTAAQPEPFRGANTILALDVGTTTGWAIRGFDGLITSGTASFRPGRFDGGGMRYLRFTNWLTELDRLSGPIEAIWFEEVRRHIGTDAAHVFGGLMATLTSWAELRGIPYSGVPVGTIKRHAAGKGNANKQAMIDAARARGFSPADDNEADAIAILLWRSRRREVQHDRNALHTERLWRSALQLEQWPLGRLVEYERNPRKNDDVVDRMAQAIVEFGFRIPIVARSDGLVVDGHLRLKAARLLGLDTVPVVLADELSEAQIRAFRLLANQSTNWAEWDEALLSAELNELLAEDFDLSLVGFSDGELDKLLAYVADSDEEAGGDGGSTPPVVIPEPPRNPASRTGDLWILGDHRLLCGDSTSETDVRRLMNGERAILFATDPPYLVDYDGSNHPTRNKDWSQSYGNTWDDSSQGAELYDGFISAAVAEAITEDAAWYCWHASRRQAMLEACWEKAGAFVHQQIIWVKDRGVLTRSHYLWKHEPCFMGWRRPNRPPKVAEQTLPSTWEMPSFSKDERPDHPTPKPLDAFGIPMRQHVARGGVCYEPFAGSGSQIMAGEANGRRVFGMRRCRPIDFCGSVVLTQRRVSF